MADYYTMFSEMLVLKGGKKAVAWAGDYLDQFDGEMVEEEHPMFEDQKALAVLYDIEPDYFHLGFEWEFQVEERKKPEVWIYAEEIGNPDHVAHFVQAYLRKFDPQGYFAFTWSTGCSKPRCGAFSGGGIFVTSVDIEWMDPETWISAKKCERDLAKEASKAKKAS